MGYRDDRKTETPSPSPGQVGEQCRRGGDTVLNTSGRFSEAVSGLRKGQSRAEGARAPPRSPCYSPVPKLEKSLLL